MATLSLSMFLWRRFPGVSSCVNGMHHKAAPRWWTDMRCWTFVNLCITKKSTWSSPELLIQPCGNDTFDILKNSTWSSDKCLIEVCPCESPPPPCKNIEFHNLLFYLQKMKLEQRPFWKIRFVEKRLDLLPVKDNSLAKIVSGKWILTACECVKGDAFYCFLWFSKALETF